MRPGQREEIPKHPHARIRSQNVIGSLGPWVFQFSVNFSLAILSDIHYAGAAEQARGDDFEYRDVSNPLLRVAVHAYRHFIWTRYPLRHNGQLDRFLHEVGNVDLIIANGDYSCSTAFVGLSDDAAFASAGECLGKLRARFGDRLRLIPGDHEFGKRRVTGDRGGMRLASWRRTVNDLGIAPFWQLDLGRYVLMGVTSSLIALPLLAADVLPEEKLEWERLREEHLATIRAAFEALPVDRRVLLFCHDPTALPFLGREAAVRVKLSQIEHTIIGHVHSNLYFRTGCLLAGMPVIHFLGHTAEKMSAALHEARHWRPFNVKLCPSLAGIELLKDGGYFTANLDADARRPAQFQFHPLKR
jgi:hypothetical protein